MPKVGNFETISGEELRRRVDRLGLTYVEAARRLGLTEDGLHKAMSGARRVGRQTEIILDCLEHHRPTAGSGAGHARPRPRNQRQAELPLDRQQRRDPKLAQHLYPPTTSRK